MTSRRLPPLQAVRAFEAAARHLSITRAAEELNVTVGAVSRHVRALEARMSTTLFLRGARGLVLTSAGKLFAEAAGEALDRLADAGEGLRRHRYRRLSIGLYGFVASRFLLHTWPRLRQVCPDLEVDLHSSANPLELLPNRYDAVIAVSDGKPRAGLVTEPLFPIAMVPICAPHLLADGRFDPRRVPLLHCRARPDDWRRWLDHAGYGDVSAQGGSTFESIGLAIEAAAAGMGASLAIESLLGPDLADGRLVPAHEIVRTTRRFFVLQYEERMAADAGVAAFAAWLTREVEAVRASPALSKQA